MHYIISVTYKEFFWVKRCVKSCFDNPTPGNIESCKRLLELFAKNNNNRLEWALHKRCLQFIKSYKYYRLINECEKEIHDCINNLIYQYNIIYDTDNDNLNKKIIGFS